MRKIFKLVIFLICILVLLFIFISFLFYSSYKELKQDITMFQLQKTIDKSINLYDYTLDNPNIINNPYKISPLTSLVIFNTKDYCVPKVTIYGKNDDDNLIYNYEEGKKHYLIIYGLYSDYDNEVNIKCGNEEKDIVIKTDKLPNDVDYKEIEYFNELNFVNSNYLYAVDNDNEIRWILTNKYNGNINILDNNNLIVSSNELYTDKTSTSILEINLLGKIYNNYYIKNKGNIFVDNNFIYVDNKNKIDRQTGEISKSKNNGIINSKLNYLNNNFILKDMVIFNNYENTKFIEKNISLINPKKIDKEYKKYNIKINVVNNRLVIEGEFEKKEVYLILENIFDKKIVKLNENINYIYSNELNDKYNIYLRIDKKLYKTNYYIKFNK